MQQTSLLPWGEGQDEGRAGGSTRPNLERPLEFSSRSKARLSMIVPADDGAIAEAARILRGGGLVAFPTETVYGLGADATDGTRGRAHIRGEGPAALQSADRACGGLGGRARSWRIRRRAPALAGTFWPGPLTLVLPRAARRAPPSRAGHRRARHPRRPRPGAPGSARLLAAAGVPIAAPECEPFRPRQPYERAPCGGRPRRRSRHDPRWRPSHGRPRIHHRRPLPCAHAAAPRRARARGRSRRCSAAPLQDLRETACARRASSRAITRRAPVAARRARSARRRGAARLRPGRRRRAP